MATKKAFVSGHDYIQDIHMEAGIYTVLMKVKSMYGDVCSFALFDGTTWTHYDMDTVQGQWKWAYVTFRTLAPMTKINLISRNYSAELPVYVVEPQIVAGNVPFDAGVASADLNKESKELQSVLQSMEYLKLAIGQEAELEGALFALVTILLKENMNASVTAGISGVQRSDLNDPDSPKDAPAFWAGGTYGQAIDGTAKVVIKHDGSGHLAGGNISWDEEGNSLFTGSIQSSDEGNKIIIDGGDRSLKMINKYDKQLVNFHFYEGSSGWGTSYPILRMDLWRKDALGEWTYGEYTDYSPFGIEFRSTDNALPWVGQLTSSSMLLSYGNEGTASERSISINLFDDQYLEMRMKGSVISNLSLKPRIVIGSSSVWLDHWDVFVTCYNTANINVYLPSSPSLGAIKFIRRMNASTVTVMGNGGQISHGNGSVSSSILAGAGRGDTAVFFWDGQYWTYNYWVRDT